MTATTPDELTAARRSALLSGWVDAVLAVVAHYQIDASRERIRVAADWSGGQDLVGGSVDDGDGSVPRIGYVDLAGGDGNRHWRGPDGHGAHGLSGRINHIDCGMGLVHRINFSIYRIEDDAPRINQSAAGGGRSAGGRLKHGEEQCRPEWTNRSVA